LKSQSLTVFALVAIAAVAAFPLFAHHGNAAYEVTRQITLKGTVTQWAWTNPHCFIRFDVRDERGQTAHWIAETENPSTMTHLGWGRQSLTAGDPITITVFPVKNGAPLGRIISVVKADGKKLPGKILPVVQYSKPEDDSKP
jgi:uncharacterized protein DUF6152